MGESVRIMRDGVDVGILSSDDAGRASFACLEENDFPPDADVFFRAFLPEGTRAETMADKDGIPVLDVVGFLRLHGADLPGNLHVGLTGWRSDEDITELVAGAIESGTDFVSLPQNSLLSGVDDKLAVIVKDNRFILPDIGNPSTHIIKKGNLLCVNELFCMRLAAKCGLSVMPCDLLSYDGTEAFITERFDRIRDSTGKILRLDQKDFCQLAGKSPDEKYFREHQGILAHGLSNRDIADILSPLPQDETWRFLAGSMYSLIIGNSDDHGKNYAILYAPEPKLAPLYDLASISGMLMFHPESTGSPRLARPIGKAWYAEDITPDDMRAHVDMFGVPFDEFAGLFSRLVADVEGNAAAVRDEITDSLEREAGKRLSPELDFLAEHMAGRCGEVFRDLARKLENGFRPEF